MLLTIGIIAGMINYQTKGGREMNYKPARILCKKCGLPKKHPYKFGVGLKKYCRCLTKPKEK
jgi:hypothetical protein